MNEIYLYGTVGESFWGEEAFCASGVVAMLDGLDGPLTVNLNSGGGVVHEGVTIYNLLRDYPGDVTINVQGIAASIASVIALAGDEIIMGEGAMVMIHDPAAFFVEGRGTEDDHMRTARGLGKAATTMANLYAKRTGLGLDEVREIMKAETYMDGPEAVAKGFATALAEDDIATDVAAYDYSTYRNAPASLRAVGRRYAAKISQPALVAMIAGMPAPERSHSMAEENQTEDEDQTTAEMEEEDQTTDTSAEEDGDMTEEDGATDTDGDDDEEEAPATATQLLRMAASFNRPAATAQYMIAQGMTATQASAHLAQEIQGANPMSQSRRRGLSRAQITRDAVETRNEGMTGALVAQMGRAREVAGPARDYMQMSLVEMAAQVADHRGPMRSATDRLRVFEAATHSTSDFPAIFEGALNARLLASYEAQQPTYTAVAERIDFSDFREMPLVRAGDFPDLLEVREGGEIKQGTFGESKETAILVPYGRQLEISRQMLINDNLGAIDRVLAQYGQKVAQFEDRTFYSFALAAKMADGKAMFHADHKNLAASGSVLSVESVDAGMQKMALQEGLDGEVLGVVPSIILTGAKQSLAAKRLVAEISATSAAEVNPYSGDFVHVQTPRITGLEWFLLAAPSAGGAQWVYGYLDGAEGPRVRTDEPFGRQGMSMSVELDFGFGAGDHRFAYKNPGAAS